MPRSRSAGLGTAHGAGAEGLDSSRVFDILTAMATTTTDLDRAATLFRALADPTRLGIIEKLRGGEQCVCDLTDALDTGQSRLSFHLKCLKDAGVLRDRREGRWIYYALNPAAIAEIESVIATLRPSRLRLVGPRCD